MKSFLFFLLVLTSLTRSVQAQPISQNQKTENITAFAKLYGYIRYFHPSDEANKINWDEFLYYGIKEVENTANKEELLVKLNRLFNPIAPAVTIFRDENPSLFQNKSITPPNRTGMKEIFWQHLGFGLNPGVYRSIRTNRAEQITDVKGPGFGNVLNLIDAQPYRGKTIRLRSLVRTENGSAQMWLRVDRKNKVMGFFDNMGSRPITKNAWEQYEISGKVDDDAERIVYGVFIVGKGKAHADNFILEINENGTWMPISIPNPSFEDSDKSTEKWITDSPGYTFEMNKDSIRGNYVTIESEPAKSRIIESIYQERPIFGSHFVKQLGNGISCNVPQVLLGNEFQTYPSADTLLFQNLNQQIKSSFPTHPNALDLYVRLNGVIITWNIFNHFYPYHEEIDSQWDKQLESYLTLAYDANSEREYLSLLRRLTEKLKDGHIYVSSPNIMDFYSLPVGVDLVESQLVITEVDSVFKDKGLNIGDIITQIDGIPALERFANLKREISGSEQWKNHRAETEFLYGPKGSEIKIQTNSAGKIANLKFVRENFRLVKPSGTIRKMENDIFYINIGATEMKDITAMMPQLIKAKGIVCDLRGYPKGNHELINHLMKKKDTSTWMFVPKVINPDYDEVSYSGSGWNISPAKPNISAKVVFITGGGAISYAESYMGFIKNYNLATIVGQPTAGANGNVTNFTLPGNYTVRFTGMKVRQQDGSQLHGLGIMPDVLVNRTLKGVTEGRDEYLEKALELLR